MPSITISGGTLITPSRTIKGASLVLEGGSIAAILPPGSSAPGGTHVLDARGCFVLPGFIDLQVNGAGGHLVSDEPGALDAIARTLIRFGTTAFLPTIVSAPLDAMATACGAIAARTGVRSSGALVLGAHLEGPFLNSRKSGIHDTNWVRDPSMADLQLLLNAGKGSVRLVTLAPELPGALALIQALHQAGVSVAVGHTEAGVAEVAAAVDAGAAMATHLFNAMGQLASREPGTVGAVLAEERLFASVIADGVHVHPTTLKATLRALGPSRAVLVTDCMPAVGAEAPTFDLHGVSVVARDGACYGPDGRLAGSVLTMRDAVRNAVRMGGLPLAWAVRMASMNPAKVLGARHKGRLAVGADADIVICDTDLNVRMTIVGGEVVYAA